MVSMGIFGQKFTYVIYPLLSTENTSDYEVKKLISESLNLHMVLCYFVYHIQNDPMQWFSVNGIVVNSFIMYICFIFIL